MIPVLLFVYNRLDHTKKTVEAISKNYGASDTELFIFSDGPKNQNSIDSVEKIRMFIDTIERDYKFKSVNIYKSLENKGLAKSIISGVTEIINRYNKVIVLEDDLITSQDFLMYMNDALNFFEHNEDIWSISGYNLPIEMPQDYKSDVYLSYRGCSWGWGTWKSKWKLVNWKVDDYEKFKGDNSLRTKFNIGGRDMAFMLDDQINGKIDSWAIRWCYSQSKLNKYTVYPVVSKVQNIGMDGSGTHSGTSDHYKSEIKNGVYICDFNKAELNAVIINRFSKHYMNDKQYLVEKYKRLIKKLLGR